MSIIRIQGPEERQKGICYEYNSEEMPLGEGGMGYVYKGYLLDERTGSTRMVAIKQMKSDLPEQAIERARREASIRLHNDNLVEMLAFIEMPARMVYGQIQKQYYIVSELLEGVMLDSILEGVVTDRYGRIVPLAQKLLADYQNHPDEFATYIVRNVLAGLLALHNAGYIHRDIDPTNIMVTTDGKVKLIDFGIAKKKNALTAHDKSFTVAGTFMGKAEYASPELALGDIASQDDTTDIYAVGILLFQCITGHTPFSVQTSLLNGLEKKALVWLAERQPKWADSDMLTFVGTIGAVVIALGFALSNISVHFLWLTIAGFVINWYGDSLDGTLARVRKQQRPVYGFYIDHTVDAINEAFMFLGAGMSPFMRFDIACVLLVVYLMLTLNVSMNAHLKGEFRLTYAKLGPTEFRLICIIACLILMFAPGLREIVIEMPWFDGVLSLGLLDIIGVVILLALVVIYLVTIIQDARYYAKIDPKHKNG